MNINSLLRNSKRQLFTVFMASKMLESRLGLVGIRKQSTPQTISMFARPLYYVSGLAVQVSPRKMVFYSSDSVSRDGQVHLIGESGKSMGLISFNEAKSLADVKGHELYLVKPVSHQSPHAVYKLLSKKDLYEMKKKRRAKEQNILKNRQKVKELSLSTDISEQDLTWKLNRIKEFLTENDKVKLIINQKRRSKNKCDDFLNEILEKLKDIGEQDGNLIEMPNRVKCILKPISGVQK